MALPANYPELIIRDKIVDVLKNDSYIGAQILNSRTSTKTIHTLSILDFTVEHYPAISVELASTEPVIYDQNVNNLEKILALYRIDCIVENENRETARDNAFKLSKAVKITLENNRNLDFKCDYLEVGKIIETAYGSKPLWAFCWSVDLMVFYFNSLTPYAVS